MHQGEIELEKAEKIKTTEDIKLKWIRSQVMIAVGKLTDDQAG